MTTTPGESGGKFNKINFNKIREFRKKFPEKNIHIDGGINDELGFIMRIFRKDLMRKKNNKEIKSYWIIRPKQKSSMKQQF